MGGLNVQLVAAKRFLAVVCIARRKDEVPPLPRSLPELRASVSVLSDERQDIATN